MSTEMDVHEVAAERGWTIVKPPRWTFKKRTRGGRAVFDRDDRWLVVREDGTRRYAADVAEVRDLLESS